MSVQITKDKFQEYKRVQESGAYNMIDPRASEMTELSKAEWVTIMREYEKLNKAWGNDDR